MKIIFFLFFFSFFVGCGENQRKSVKPILGKEEEKKSSKLNPSKNQTDEKEMEKTNKMGEKISKEKKLRFLALGDSYTIGESVQESKRWPIQLVEQLREKGVFLETPKIIATTGWTTDELLEGIEKDLPQGTYELVTLLIGVNNQYRGRSQEEYRKEFALLLEKAVYYAGDRPKRVIVLSIPDWGQTPFAEGRNREEISQEIDLFNNINQQETAKKGAFYVDVTPISRKGLENPALVTKDHLHPSGLMYQEWTTLVFEIALKILQS